MRHFSKYGAGLKPAPVEPTATYGDNDVLDVPGRPRAIGTPGHTPGHCALYFERHGALFVGDALCTWQPVKGTTGPQLMPSSFNTSNDQALRSLAAIENVDAKVLLPGHGEPWRDGARAAVARVRETGRT
jgi:glyoxylase-like metal-dependent hydrolase (beta-lactamase superfamily II)